MGNSPLICVTAILYGIPAEQPWTFFAGPRSVSMIRTWNSFLLYTYIHSIQRDNSRKKPWSNLRCKRENGFEKTCAACTTHIFFSKLDSLLQIFIKSSTFTACPPIITDLLHHKQITRRRVSLGKKSSSIVTSVPNGVCTLGLCLNILCIYSYCAGF